MANLGPADYNYDESISSLRYANRAKNIKNKARINEDPKDALLRQLQEEMERLKQQLENGGAVSGVCSSAWMLTLKLNRGFNLNTVQMIYPLSALMLLVQSVKSVSQKHL